MSLKRERSRLFKLAVKLRLTEFHVRAAFILLDVNGYDNAAGYLQKCADARNEGEVA